MPGIARPSMQSLLDAAHDMTSASQCGAVSDGLNEAEIMVCGRRRSDDRYRLPLRGERPPSDQLRRHPGEAPRASANAAPLAPCGIFQGQRRCSKTEAREYGYGGGRDPLSATIRLGTLLVDPDADVALPVDLPRGAAAPPR
ncbi:hypothetical protein PX699_26910 [Sphingobium sp. H39-3-25]|uniref:hypothetical protein n=1 Tax=Sphingobium arseniciresistens TaxID=3030834 RepID=UPI0023B9274D|nr:hypothetical protein [Sphingobium arseniciresistens]